jgi:hypothetical protein
MYPNCSRDGCRNNIYLGGLRCSSRFAGRTVYLSFFVETDALLTTSFYLDRVALEGEEQPS